MVYYQASGDLDGQLDQQQRFYPQCLIRVWRSGGEGLRTETDLRGWQRVLVDAEMYELKRNKGF